MSENNPANTTTKKNRYPIILLTIFFIYVVINFSGLAQPSTQVYDLSKAKLIMYSTTSCSYCRQARYFFAKNKIAYYEYNIDESAIARQQFNALAGFATPLIMVGKYRINGFDKKTLRKLLIKN